MTKLPHSSKLNIPQFSKLFDKMSESYKIFWFRAIFEAVTEGRQQVSFDELINHMIVDAWYMVTEYRLNLGPSDNLEVLVKYLQSVTRLQSNAKPKSILVALESLEDKEFIRLKRVLIQNVPYRLQAPFMPGIKGKDWDGKIDDKILRINQQERLMYYFLGYAGLHTEIRVSDEWLEYIIENQTIIQGWIEYNMVSYLQRRNPNVPGIIYKLYPPEKRKLEAVKKLWKSATVIHPIKEIYQGIILEPEMSISIDHFVPWSFVTHDEMWNLSPTTRSINSSKGNNLPDWDKYFSLLCDTQYDIYDLSFKYDSVYKEFEKCKKENVNDSSVLSRLYAPGLTRDEFSAVLGNVLHPVYEAAVNQGFEIRNNIGDSL